MVTIGSILFVFVREISTNRIELTTTTSNSSNCSNIFLLTRDFVGASVSPEPVAFQHRVEFPGNKRNQSFHRSFDFRWHKCRSHIGNSFWKPADTNTACSKTKTRATDVLLNKNRTQAATEWSRLLLHDVICSERVPFRRRRGRWECTARCLSLVTLTFDVSPWHSNSSERGTKHVFPVNLAQLRSGVPEVFDSQTKNKSQTALKTEPYAFYCVR